MTSRRTFFASIVGLGIPKPKAEQLGPVWKQMRPYTAAEEKEINDRWKRIEATLDRSEANGKAFEERWKARGVKFE